MVAALQQIAVMDQTGTPSREQLGQVCVWGCEERRGEEGRGGEGSVGQAVHSGCMTAAARSGDDECKISSCDEKMPTVVNVQKPYLHGLIACELNCGKMHTSLMHTHTHSNKTLGCLEKAPLLALLDFLRCCYNS